MIAPIPASLMPHVAYISERDVTSRYDGAYLDPVTYTRVRLEPATSLRKTSYDLKPDTQGVLFIDASTSAPATPPQEGAKVECAGFTGYVAKVHTFHAFTDTPHHWEVELHG